MREGAMTDDAQIKAWAEHECSELINGLLDCGPYKSSHAERRELVVAWLETRRDRDLWKTRAEKAERERDGMGSTVAIFYTLLCDNCQEKVGRLLESLSSAGKGEP